MAGVEPHYRADPSDAVCSVELEGLTLLYHRASGMTHVLAPPSPEILGELRGGVATLSELEARLEERFDLVGGADILAERLQELVAAGLIEKA